MFKIGKFLGFKYDLKCLFWISNLKWTLIINLYNAQQNKKKKKKDAVFTKDDALKVDTKLQPTQ